MPQAFVIVNTEPGLTLTVLVPPESLFAAVVNAPLTVIFVPLRSSRFPVERAPETGKLTLPLTTTTPPVSERKPLLTLFTAASP